MTFRLVDKGWGRMVQDAAEADAGALRIICPFIKMQTSAPRAQVAWLGSVSEWLGQRPA